METSRIIATALTPLVFYLWWKGSARLKHKLRQMKPGVLRSILLWPSK
jgi:hypothetical protein